MHPPPVHVSEKVARLRRTLLFSDLAPSTLRSLAEKAVEEAFSPGSLVVEEGNDGDVFRASQRNLTLFAPPLDHAQSGLLR